VVGSPGELTVSLECRRENFPRLLRLGGEILREPAVPEAELSALKRGQKQRLEQGRTDPPTPAPNAPNRKPPPSPKTDIRYQPTLDEQIARVDAVTIEQVRRLYAEQLSGQVGEFAAVGDFDPTTTRELLAEILKDWKTAVVYKRIPASARTDIPASREDIRTPDKANALFTAAHLLAMRSDHPDYLALQMADYIFG